MVDQGDDDSFFLKFIESAKQRQAKLAGTSQRIEAHIVAAEAEQRKSKNNNILEQNHQSEVSYPPLSPLPEEVDSDEREDDENVSNSNLENKSQDELNYSSDLSLNCDQQQETDNDISDADVYRAKPIYATSSPEHNMQPPASIPFSQISPRKRALSIPQQDHQQHYVYQNQRTPQQADQKTPLHERQSEQKATSSQSLPEMSDTDQFIQNLQIRVQRAEQTRAQLKKAVEASKHGTKEHIEAARLLQIAEVEHLNYTGFMAMYKQGIRKTSESLGSVLISNIRLKLTSRMRNDLAEDGVSHYFFFIASCGTEVKATGIIDTDDIRRQDLKTYAQFREKITFTDLAPDFVVKIEVFELVISQPLPKLLLRLTPSKKSKITPESYFRRVGSLKLTLSDRDVICKNLIQWSKLEESKYVERECKFLMELKPEQLPSKSGMLHVRCLNSAGKPDGTRYFVDLAGGFIKFWKSKQDALDEKKPNQTYEFKELCSTKVQKLTPEDPLYIQNSFVIYTYQQVTGGDNDTLFQRVLSDDPKFKIVKHQLAADDKEEREKWCAVLDRSMNCFREWHGQTKIFSFEELEEIFSQSY